MTTWIKGKLRPAATVSEYHIEQAYTEDGAVSSYHRRRIERFKPSIAPAQPRVKKRGWRKPRKWHEPR